PRSVAQSHCAKRRNRDSLLQTMNPDSALMAYRETMKIRDRKAAQREALLVAAEALVREGGFAALTVQALAARAGVGVGTVYRYFRAKDELAAEVFRCATEREVAAVAAALQGQPDTATSLRE